MHESVKEIQFIELNLIQWLRKLVFWHEGNQLSINFPDQGTVFELFIDFSFFELPITKVVRMTACPEPDGFKAKSVVLLVGNFKRASDEMMHIDVSLVRLQCGVQENHFQRLKKLFRNWRLWFCGFSSSFRRFLFCFQ